LQQTPFILELDLLASHNHTIQCSVIFVKGNGNKKIMNLLTEMEKSAQTKTQRKCKNMKWGKTKTWKHKTAVFALS